MLHKLLDPSSDFDLPVKSTYVRSSKYQVYIQFHAAYN